MREIKFRVWCEFEIDGKLEKSMESSASWFLLTQTGELWSHGLSESPRPIGKEYKKAIPLFYTGLKDKNGKGVYEGDILQHESLTQKEVVEWKSNMWTEEGFMTGYGEWFGPADQYEIVGNIYENPELIKGE